MAPYSIIQMKCELPVADSSFVIFLYFTSNAGKVCGCMCGGAFANAIRAIEHKPRKEITDRKIYESKIV